MGLHEMYLVAETRETVNIHVYLYAEIVTVSQDCLV